MYLFKKPQKSIAAAPEIELKEKTPRQTEFNDLPDELIRIILQNFNDILELMKLRLVSSKINKIIIDFNAIWIKMLIKYFPFQPITIAPGEEASVANNDNKFFKSFKENVKTISFKKNVNTISFYRQPLPPSLLRTALLGDLDGLKKLRLTRKILHSFKYEKINNQLLINWLFINNKQNILDYFYQEIIIKAMTSRISGKLDYKQVDDDHMTLLDWAVITHQEVKVLQEIINKGCDLDLKIGTLRDICVGDQALGYAAQYRNLKAIEFFLTTYSTQIHINSSQNSFDLRPIHLAVMSGCLETVKCICEKGGKFYTQDNTPGNNRILGDACYTGNLELVKYLKKKGFKSDITLEQIDSERGSLFQAAASDNKKILENLLEEKTDEERNQIYLHLFRVAVRGANLSVAKFLVECGLVVKDILNSDLICSAVVSRSITMLEYLLQEDTNHTLINELDSDRQTALHYAVEETGEISIIEKLLEYGADINIATQQGRIPIQIPEHLNNHEQTQIFKAFEKAGQILPVNNSCSLQ